MTDETGYTTDDVSDYAADDTSYADSTSEYSADAGYEADDTSYVSAYDGGGGAGGAGGTDGGGGAEGAGGGSGGETVTEVRKTTKTFGQHFGDCMGGMGLPAPTSLFTSFTTATATVAAIERAVTAYGTEVTIGELIGAGLLADGLAAAGAVAASFYAGACVGCLGAAGIDWATD